MRIGTGLMLLLRAAKPTVKKLPGSSTTSTERATMVYVVSTALVNSTFPLDGTSESTMFAILHVQEGVS